jgi:hypothetical protein
MLAAFDAGVNWVDTAAVYGAGGGSETIVGEAIADRRALLVSTEVAPEPLARFRKDGLVWSIEESPRRIGRSSVDLYVLHWSEPSVPIEHTWQGVPPDSHPIRVWIEGGVRIAAGSDHPLALGTDLHSEVEITRRLVADA